MLNQQSSRSGIVQVICAASVALAALLVAACSGQPDATSSASLAEPTPQGAEGKKKVGAAKLEATSNASLEAGIHVWELNSAGIARAFDADGNPIVTLTIIENHGGMYITDNPSSMILLNEEGKVEVDTMTDRERLFTIGLSDDLFAATERQSTEAANGQQPFEWVAFACCNAGLAATLHVWWPDTAHCAFRQHTPTCTGLPHCGTIAANAGCQFWY